MIQSTNQIAEKLQAALGKLVEKVYEDDRGTVICLALHAIPKALAWLKQNPTNPFDILVDQTAVDWSAWSDASDKLRPPKRFSLFYNLYSTSTQSRLFLEAHLNESELPISATSWFDSANWAEREIFDMFGIRFSGHPQMERILLPEDFEGFPLRKEFPLQGKNPQDFPQE